MSYTSEITTLQEDMRLVKKSVQNTEKRLDSTDQRLDHIESDIVDMKTEHVIAKEERKEIKINITTVAELQQQMLEDQREMREDQKDLRENVNFLRDNAITKDTFEKTLQKVFTLIYDVQADLKEVKANLVYRHEFNEMKNILDKSVKDHEVFRLELLAINSRNRQITDTTEEHSKDISRIKKKLSMA